MDEDFFKTVRDTDSIINISLYPPMFKKIENIQRMLQKNNVKSRVLPPINKFFMNQILEPHDQMAEMFLNCGASQCHNIYEGKIAACGKPFVTKYFNACFDKNIPEDGVLDLYEPNMTTKKIKDHLITPFERCRYCVGNTWVDWKTVSHPDSLSDWIVNA